MSTDPVVWGLHMKHFQHFDDRWPIKNGVVAIGWHELGDLSTIAPTREAFKEAYAAAFPTVTSAQGIAVSGGQPFRFLHEMKVGDVVIYASKSDRMVNIGRVSGPYQFVQDAEDQYPNRRAVAWHKHINRDE